MKIKVQKALGVAGVCVGLIVAPALASAAFKLRPPAAPVEVEPNPAPVFDRGEYEVWVDHTYTAVIEYGRPGVIEQAPSYGDPMLLEDALKLLLPKEWQAMRSQELAAKGRIQVTWDMERANWIDILQNLGERHGLKFHIDHANQEVFIQNGRRLIFDRPMTADLYEPRNTSRGSGEQQGPSADYSTPQQTVTFTLSRGEEASVVLEDLALLLGYEKTYWMMGTKHAMENRTFTGTSMTVLGQAAKAFDGKACLYEQDKVAAFVSKSQECPR